MSAKNPWKTLSSREIYSNRWISVAEHQVINPGGGKGIYGKVSFKHLAVGIIPVDDELNTWLVGQYRYTLNTYSWEIPEGGGHPDEEPIIAAQRELAEETGLTARSWEFLLAIHTSNSVTDELGHIYLARDLTAGTPNPEESESDLKIKRLPLSEAVEMVMDGQITDSLSVAGLLKAARILNL